jgi:hypothetical protein
MVPEAGPRRSIVASLLPAPVTKVKVDSCSALVPEDGPAVMSGGTGDGVWPCS